MRKTRSIRLVLAVALTLSVLGSPMAWAHWLDGDAHLAAAVTDMPAGCHGRDSHADGNDHAPAPGSMPCCDGGGCVCAAAALMVAAIPQTSRIAHPPLQAPLDTSALPAYPVDDRLRPPIH